jgi:hypothetical protein
MHQLCASAAGAFAEIVGFHQHDAEAACRSVDGNPDAGRSASNHRDVPRFVLL